MPNLPQEIRPEHLITDLLSTVDRIMGLFVQNGYENLVRQYQGVITLLMTLYVMGIGYRFAMRTLEMDIVTVSKHLILLLVVFGLLMKWDLFWLFFYNIFTNEPTHIAKAMMDANGNLSIEGKDTAMALNAVFTKGMQAVSDLFKQANWKNVMLYLYAIAVFVVTCLSSLFALGLLIYAKLGLALLLFIAPLFLCFLLFNTTRRLFENWLQGLLNFAFIPILTCGILMLMLSIAQVCLPGLNKNIASGEVQFSGLLPYVGISLVTAFLLKQVLPLAASLANGLALESLTGITPMARNLAKYSGANKATRWVFNKLRGGK